MNKLSETTIAPALPANLAETAANLLKASEGSAQFMKFKKGKFISGDTEVPIGTEHIAYCRDWVRGFVKFVDGEKVDDKIGRVADGFVPPDRNDLDDLDESKWPAGIDGKPSDPWQFQHYLPLENVETGDRYLFVTGSAGGTMAVRAVCNRYARNVSRNIHCGLPTVRLAVSTFTSKTFGEVPRPEFEIVRWECETSDSIEVLPPIKQELNDDIPF